MRRLLPLGILALVLLGLPAHSGAATPAGGKLAAADGRFVWTGMMNGVAPQDPAACDIATCDELALEVALPAGALAKGTGLQIGLRWAEEALDLDLYVYGPDGALAGKSNGFQASTSESVQIPDPVNGTYTVKVSPAFTNGEDMAYEGLAEFEAPIPVHPLRDLLPDLVPIGPRNLSFKTAQYLTDLGLPTNELSSCYPEERIEQGAARCLRFDQVIANFGQGPFELRYRLDQIAQDQSLLQRIYRSDGSVSERKADTFEFHPAHAHFHYKNFAQSKLWASNVAGERLGKDPVRVGKKNGFCMIDVEDSWFGRKGDAPRTYYFPRCNVPTEGPDGEQSMINGISPGWADIYNWYLADQFIEITGVADGYYVLETIADANNTIVEADEHDNVTQSLIRITGDSAEFVDQPPPRAPAPAAAVSQTPRLRVAVRPAKLRAGRRARLSITVTALQAGRFAPVRGARLSVLGRSARTDKRGHARIVVTPRRAGTLTIRASHRGMRSGVAKLRVARR